MTTGEIFELPRNSYTFPTLAERKIMLQIMISLCENGMADYRIIKNSIKDRLYVLPDDTAVLPGHMGATTIGDEKRGNPFV